MTADDSNPAGDPGEHKPAAAAASGRMATMLLSIDLPLKRATLHNEFCELVPRPLGTRLKPVGTIGPEGAWFAVVDEVQAARVAAQHLPQSTLVRCPKC
jgi:hypothetical protein